MNRIGIWNDGEITVSGKIHINSKKDGAAEKGISISSNQDIISLMTNNDQIATNLKDSSTIFPDILPRDNVNWLFLRIEDITDADVQQLQPVADYKLVVLVSSDSNVSASNDAIEIWRINDTFKSLMSTFWMKGAQYRYKWVACRSATAHTLRFADVY